jgi:osmotically inducible protein OsmC
MPTRISEAAWEGNLKEGKGVMKMPGFEGPYTFSSRFEEARGSNPEEMIGAALAGCYSMALSAELSKAGFTVNRISTRAEVTLGMVDGNARITSILLDCKADAGGGNRADFEKIAQATKSGCPVGAALNAPINLHAQLL